MNRKIDKDIFKKNISDSAKIIRTLIEKAINSHEITIDEHEKITHLATADGLIDNHEKALLAQLNDLINDKTIKFVKSKEAVLKEKTSLTKDEIKILLNDEFIIFEKKWHGVMNGSDLQTLAQFIMQINEKLK